MKSYPNLKEIYKSFFLLHKRERLSFYYITLASIISGLFEIVVVSSIIPIIYFIIDKQKLINLIQIYNNYVKDWFDILVIENLPNLYVIMIIFIFIIIFSAIFKLLLFYIFEVFGAKAQSKLALKLLQKIYNISLFEYESSPNSYYIRQVHNDIDLWSKGLIKGLLEIFQCFFLIFFPLIISIIYLGFDSFIIFVIALILCLTLTNFVKKYILILGEKDRAYNNICMQLLVDLIAGFQTISISKNTTSFHNKYYKTNLKSQFYKVYLRLIQKTPSFLITLIGQITFLGFITYLIFKGTPNSELLAKTGYLAIFISRVLPSINIIISRFTRLFSAIPFLRKLNDWFYKKEHLFIKNKIQEKFDKWKLLTIENLEIKPNNNKTILKVNKLTFERGKKYIILGKSGSGKSTLAHFLVGLVKPFKVNLKIDGKKIVYNQFESFLSEVALIPQNPYIIQDTVSENIRFESNVSKEDIVLFTKESGVFPDMYDDGSITNMFENQAAELSGGQKHRLAFLRLFFLNFSIVIFDEPSSSLDNINSNNIRKIMFEKFKDKTIIWITHKREDMKYFDKVISLD